MCDVFYSGMLVSSSLCDESDGVLLCVFLLELNSFLNACTDQSKDFIKKVRSIVEDNQSNQIEILNKNLETIFSVSSSGRRTQQSFYALWYFISEISLESIKENKLGIRKDLHDLFQLMNMIESKELFANNITSFWDKYQ